MLLRQFILYLASVNPQKLSKEEKINQELDDIRKQINEIDDKIIDLLNKRANIVIKIGNLKKSLNLEISQPKREEEIKERIKKKATIFYAAWLWRFVFFLGGSFYKKIRGISSWTI